MKNKEIIFGIKMFCNVTVFAYCPTNCHYRNPKQWNIIILSNINILVCTGFKFMLIVIKIFLKNIVYYYYYLISVIFNNYKNSQVKQAHYGNENMAMSLIEMKNVKM